MKIDAIDIFLVNMPLKYPFRTSFGNDSSIESVLVKLTSGDYYGWGEASPWSKPGYSPEFGEGAYYCLKKFLAPMILSKEIESGDKLQDLMSAVKGNYFAKACVDLAWWDLHAKMENKPLWKLIGGKNQEVAVGADFGVMENLDMLLKEIDGAVKSGFKRVKLKYRPGWDLNMVKEVRKNFPDLVFHIDCNAAYTLKDLSMFKELDKYNLAMIEQPLAFNDIGDHAELAKEINTPICLDESIVSVDSVKQAHAVNACKWVNIKPGRVGGITNAIKIHDYCESVNIPCWIGGMLESSVGANHCLALATMGNILYPSDIFPSSRFYYKDLSDPEMELYKPGFARASDRVGCGAEPDMKELIKNLVYKKTFK